MDINRLSIEQLKQLRQQIDDLITEKTNQNHTNKIKEKIFSDGYYCDKNFSDRILEYKVMVLPLYVDICTICNMSSLSGEQEPWVDKLRFDEDNRNCGCHCLIINSTTINIYVHYKLVPCPPEGSMSDSINESGGIDKIEVRNNKIWINGTIYCNTNEWHLHDFFVLKDN